METFHELVFSVHHIQKIYRFKYNNSRLYVIAFDCSKTGSLCRHLSPICVHHSSWWKVTDKPRRCKIQFRCFHKPRDITDIAETLPTQVFGLVQRLHLPVARPSLSLSLIHSLISLSIKATFHLVQLPPDPSPFVTADDPCFLFTPFLKNHLPSSLCVFPPSALTVLPRLSVLSWIISRAFHSLRSLWSPPLPLPCLPLPSLVLSYLHRIPPDPSLSIVPVALLAQRHADAHGHLHTSPVQFVYTRSPCARRRRRREEGRSCSVCLGEHIAWGFSRGEWKLSPVRYRVCI